MAARNRTVQFRKHRDAVKSVRAPLSSSSAAASGGPAIEMVSASLLGPNRSSYAPLSTEEPGPSSRYAYLFFFCFFNYLKSLSFKGLNFISLLEK